MTCNPCLLNVVQFDSCLLLWLPENDHSSRHIIEAVCREFHVEPDKMMSKNRASHYVMARHVAAYLLRLKTTLTLLQIASIFGNDHTSTLYAVRKITVWCEIYPEVHDRIQSIIQRL